MADVLKKPSGTIASDDEQAALQRLRAALQSGQPPTLLGPDGQPVPIPQTVLELMQQSVEHLMRGDYVRVNTFPPDLTPQQAAELLHVSRQFVVKLINEGTLTINGPRRRLRLGDVLRYKEQRNVEERQGLAELARLSQEMGLYDNA